MKAIKTLILALAGTLCATAAPTGRWLETRHNFGAFSEESGPVTCTFTLVNDGLEPLAIISGRATCGCTHPKYPTTPIEPGDSARVEVTFDPGGRPGRFNKQVYIETNGSPKKTRLDILGVVIGSGETVARRYPVDFGPLKMANRALLLGEVDKGKLKTVYFEGYNESADSLRVKVVQQPKWLDVTPAPEVAPPGEQVTLLAYVNSAKCPLYGLVEDSVVIEPTPGQRYTLPLTLLVKEDFSKLSAAEMKDSPMTVIENQTVDLGQIDRAGEPVTATFTISNAGKHPLKIRRVYSTDAGVSVSCDATEIKKGKKARVTVTVDPRVQTGGLLNSRVNVVTNDPLSPTQVVRIVGTY